ncbi:hypothetical protein, partial [Komagataeibacter oboediens]|uniref:hypothetical protein n=1 Tax=Komagataeibacter oboediens TaxID=65958 RepID=UPI001C2D35DE|nr:hypothetical protein [Komagataeibacter oboediens]
MTGYGNHATLDQDGYSFLEVEDEACRDVDCRHECVSAAVVSGDNTLPVFQLCEHVFDQMALFIESVRSSVYN